jgi:hypothetical protein
MERQNNELFQGKPSLPALPMLGFSEAGLSKTFFDNPAVSSWLFCRENFFVPTKQPSKSTVKILTIEP